MGRPYLNPKEVTHTFSWLTFFRPGYTSSSTRSRSFRVDMASVWSTMSARSRTGFMSLRSI